ncbi:hypothetical protein AVEN_227322-1 [Araneus ventricosus]|uniref:Uncharacterized protein n=1 Tax=Araneus ventricosus TaxID=182803 RepID=A0A4Y2GWA8_ARAVE|nr:hypothetical protein AVEN_227322-1 [Araneus ventricosus]
MDKLYASSLISDLRDSWAEQVSLGKEPAQSQPISPTARAPPPTYASVTSSSRHTILLFPKEEDTNALRVLKEHVNPVKAGLSITTVRPLRKQGVAVDCCSKEDAQKLLSQIKNSKLAEALDTKRPEPRYPRCVVYDIPNGTEDTEVLEAMSIATGANSSDLKVSFKIKSKNDRSHFVVSARPEIIKALLA